MPASAIRWRTQIKLLSLVGRIVLLMKTKNKQHLYIGLIFCLLAIVVDIVFTYNEYGKFKFTYLLLICVLSLLSILYKLIRSA